MFTKIKYVSLFLVLIGMQNNTYSNHTDIMHVINQICPDGSASAEIKILRDKALALIGPQLSQEETNKLISLLINLMNKITWQTLSEMQNRIKKEIISFGTKAMLFAAMGKKATINLPAANQEQQELAILISQHLTLGDLSELVEASQYINFIRENAEALGMIIASVIAKHSPDCMPLFKETLVTLGNLEHIKQLNSLITSLVTKYSQSSQA